MTNTRNWLMILILPFIFASSSALAAFADNLSGVCEKSSGSIIKVYAGLGAPAGSSPFKQAADTNNDGDQCSEIPDAYRINIYKFGTCTADPFPANDFSTCSYFINSDDTPVTHTIEGIGVPTPLATTGSIAPGTYPYGFMILSNSLEVKHTQTYDTAMFSNPDERGIVAGPVCWSIDYTTSYGGFDAALREKGTTSSTGIECGAPGTEAPAFTKEIFDSMGEGHPAAFLATDATSHTLPSGDSMKAKLLQDDNKSVATGFGNAKRIFAVVDFATDKVVTASSKFEIKFKLTDAVSVDSGFNGTDQYIVKMGADPFQVDVVVTD